MMPPALQHIDQTLQIVAVEQRSAGEIVPSGANESEVEMAKSALKMTFGLDLPESYIALLKQRNGIDYNGVVFYSALDTPEKPGAAGFWQGLVAANQAWRDGGENTNLLILGDNSMDFFAFDPATGDFGRYDRVTCESLARYDTADQMVEAALSPDA